jgi:pimeloyl-ACP methyl ester carboxylesterase
MSSATRTTAHVSNRLPQGTIELGQGEPLILLHGVMGSPVMWRHTMPLLAATHRVIALAAYGHQGGRPCEQRPCRIEHVVDDAERSLDALGLQRVHLAGNSMGGWMALELARRGRARSVCALSPAGMWETTENFPGAKKLRSTVTMTRLSRATLPLTSKLPNIRRFALRDTAEHGDRVSPAMLVELADALLACSVGEDLLSTPEKFAPLEVSCPVDVVWAKPDRIFPPEIFAVSARQRVPGARHLVLEDVGHVPMLDNPELVARAILETVARAKTIETDRGTLSP